MLPIQLNIKLILKHIVQLGMVCLIRVTTYNKQLTVETIMTQVDHGL